MKAMQALALTLTVSEVLVWPGARDHAIRGSAMRWLARSRRIHARRPH